MLNNKDLLGFKKSLYQIGFGNKITGKKNDPIHVVDCIRTLSRSHQKAYDTISEFTHPNYAGVMHSYSAIQEDNHTIHFGNSSLLIHREFCLLHLGNAI